MPTGFDRDPVISFDHISVLYHVPREKISGMKEFFIRWLQRRIRFEDFWALKDVSFQVRAGEIFGVIGRNGAGKSTLLKVMARVIQPTTGRAVVRGRIAPLLELGAGFHPELTGRENIFLNSALLGIKNDQVRALFDSIIEFAEIGDFVEAPIRTYSTGMVARLGFSVATCTRPDVLLVDELLSVGDAQFQKKCLELMRSFRDAGTTIVLVSHSMAAIEGFCERAVWLNHGRVEALGGASNVARYYASAGQPEEDAHPVLISEPILESVIKPSGINDYLHLPEIGNIYPAAGVFNVEQGTVSTWIRLTSNEPLKDTVIFHTDDSRYVLFAGSYPAPNGKGHVHVVIARAGGNQRVMDTFYGQVSFPEVPAALDSLPEIEGEHAKPLNERWVQVAMTWHGYPDGQVRIYLNGLLLGERSYNRQYDDGRPLPSGFAIGMRPTIWTGELIRKEDGSVHDSRPISTMSALANGLRIEDMRLYQRALTPEEVQELAQAGMAGS